MAELVCCCNRKLGTFSALWTAVENSSGLALACYVRHRFVVVAGCNAAARDGFVGPHSSRRGNATGDGRPAANRAIHLRPSERKHTVEVRRR